MRVWRKLTSWYRYVEHFEFRWCSRIWFISRFVYPILFSMFWKEKILNLNWLKFFPGKSFLKSPGGQFVNANSWQYGFIIRYPIDKKLITGIPFEPWHIRYVGKPHAEIIYKENLTLEEYIESLDIDKFYKFNDYVISRQKTDILTFPRDLIDIVVSADNKGNFIITGIEHN